MSRTDTATRAQYITLYTVDPITSDPQEKCTYGVLANSRGWAQWGRSDTTEQYAVGLDRMKKNFIVVDPTRPCDQAFQLIPIRFPADLGPYASTGISMPMPATGGTSRRGGDPWDNRWLPPAGTRRRCCSRTSTTRRTRPFAPTCYIRRSRARQFRNAPRWQTPKGW
jgi:hypothetical protein